MTDVNTPQKKQDRWVIPSLFVSIYAAYPTGVAMTVLLLEIGHHFNAPISLTGQLRTASSLVSLATALLMSILSLKYRHRSLLLIGLLSIGISAVGCGLSTSFPMMIPLYALTGLGISMVTPMAFTLVAEHLPLDRRTSGIGWLNAGGGLSHIIGAALIGTVASLWGWRAAFLGYSLPLVVLGLMACIRGLPQEDEREASSQGEVMNGFRAIFSNKSAVACLLANILVSVSWQGVYFFVISFIKERYSVATGFAALIYSIMSAGYTVGSMVSGKYVNRLGRKPATIFGVIALSLCTIVAMNPPSYLICIVVSVLGPFVGAFRAVGGNSLMLEQVPEYRGAVMSMNQAANWLGTAIGTGFGSVFLVAYGWGVFGLTLGVLGFISAGIFQLLVIDPTASH